MQLVKSLVGMTALGMGLNLACAQSVRNEFLQARFLPKDGLISFTVAGGRQTFFQVPVPGVSVVRVATVADPVFGSGKALAWTSPAGPVQVAVYPRLPFALWQATLANPGPAILDTNQVKVLAGILPWRAAAELKCQGTGGLTGATNAPGSYMWMAVADPATGQGMVAGWLTTERGSGVLFARATNQTVRLEAQLDYGHLRIAPGRPTPLETLAIGFFDDARLGLEAYADAIARAQSIRLRPQPTGYCTWYSSPHGGASDEQSLQALAGYCATNLAPYGFRVVQIDDGWQAGVSTNGPKRNFSTHAAKGPYPAGMKAAADGIKAQGLVPGIWFMPFAGTYYDPFFAGHQDWFVRTTNGAPYETAWGGTCLDMTHPGARAYLRENVRRIAKEWGYDYFKMDGLWTGSATRQIYVNSSYRFEGIGDAVFSNPEVSNLEAFRSGLRLVREAAGEQVFFLGCCAPQNMRSYGGAFGLVDAMRVGPDNGADWEGLLRGPIFGSRHYFLHGRVWYNDPDPVYVRQGIPLAHARLICSWVALSGQLNLNSEWVPGLPAERLEVLRRTMPAHGLTARPVDYFASEPARIWRVADERRHPGRVVAGLFNWGRTEAEITCSAESLGLPARAPLVAYDYWDNSLVAPFTGVVRQRVPAQACRVLAVQALAAHPQILSASRHVTQGLMEAQDGRWKAPELSGQATVVGGEAAEVRVLLHSTRGRWEVAAAEVAEADRAAGVKISHQVHGGLLRLTLASPVGRTVAWTVRFGKAPRAEGPPAPVTRLEAAQALPLSPVALTWDGDAAFYEVKRGETLLAAGQSGNRYSDASAPGGTRVEYQVTPISFSGQRGAAIKTAVDVLKADPGPIPPKPSVFLDDLKPAKATTGWGQVHFGQSVEGKEIRVAGKAYQKGVGVHAASELVYSCRPEYRRFVAVAGLDDEKADDARPSVVFEVYAGKKLLAASPVLKRPGLTVWHCNVPIPDQTKTLRLVVNDAGDGIAADHADWAAAGFVTEK